MNATELARVMLEWQEAQAHADLLKAEIEAAVLALGKSQTVGNVRATYSAGRKSYNYQEGWQTAVAAGQVHPQALDPFITVIPETTRIDYTTACKTLEIAPPFTQSAPAVSLKIIAQA